MSELKEMSAVTLNETNGGKVLELQLTGTTSMPSSAKTFAASMESNPPDIRTI